MKKSKEAKRDGTPITKKAALGFIVPLCLLSVLLSALVISVANDMYAFVKPDREISVRIDAPVSAKELSRLLKGSGVIRNEFVFELYLDSKGKSEKAELILGEWTLNSNMSYRRILLEIF